MVCQERPDQMLPMTSFVCLGHFGSTRPPGVPPPNGRAVEVYCRATRPRAPAGQGLKVPGHTLSRDHVKGLPAAQRGDWGGAALRH